MPIHKLILNIPADCTNPDEVVAAAIAIFNKANPNSLVQDEVAKRLITSIKQTKVFDDNPQGGVIELEFCRQNNSSIQDINIENAYPTINADTPDEALEQTVHALRGCTSQFLFCDDPAYLEVKEPLSVKTQDKFLKMADITKAPSVDLNVADQYPKTMEFPNTPTSIKTVPEYCALIRGWATDRNIIGGGSTALDQFIKGLTEAGELWTHVGKGQRDLISDDIGDIIVCIINTLGNYDIKLEDHIHSDLLSAGNPINVNQYFKYGLKRYSLQVLYGLVGIANTLELMVDNDRDGYLIDTQCLKQSLGGDAARLVNILDAIARAHQWSLEECLHVAYTDIKDRRGLMTSGCFVKEKDFTVEMVNTAIVDESTKPAIREHLNEWLQKNA